MFRPISLLVLHCYIYHSVFRSGLDLLSYFRPPRHIVVSVQVSISLFQIATEATNDSPS